MAGFVTEHRSIPNRRNEKKTLTREDLMIQSLSPQLNVMIKAVRVTGRKMLRDFGEISLLQVSQKAPGNFVSNADILAEKTLVQLLSQDKPDAGFICEERGTTAPKNNCPYTWIIDPIDGTLNFIHAIPYFAISVALKKEDEIIAGVIYNPITNELYYAEKGHGAFVMTPTGENRLRVSGRSKMNMAMVGSNGFSEERTQTTLKKISKKVASIRFNGSAALAMCAVAAGHVDAYVSTMFGAWDISAGNLLIKEAGGYVCDFSGNYAPAEIQKKQQLLACNAELKEAFIAELSKD